MSGVTEQENLSNPFLITNSDESTMYRETTMELNERNKKTIASKDKFFLEVTVKQAFYKLLGNQEALNPIKG